MHRSKIEKLTDYVIGEAVAALLEQNAAISGASLANRLKTMAIVETDGDRQQALTLALAEVRQEFPSAQGVTDAPLRSLNAHVLAGVKKH